MTVPTGTTQTYQQIGRREDLSDVIYDISPTEVPFMSSIGRTSTDATYTEWQTDTLAAADGDNAVIEGDDATNDTATATVRLGNYTQLMDKVVQVASSARAVKTAGRKDEFSYQLAKRAKELKRDMETRLTGNYASVAGAAGTARKAAGFEAWIQTNDSRGVGGANTAFTGGIQAAATDGTQRAFTETLLQDVLQLCWENGGSPSLVMVGGFNKKTASGFDGIATQYNDAANKKPKIVASADVFVSDFGTVNIVANRFSRSRSALVIDPEFWDVAYLQPFKTEDLAKTGHSDRKMLSVEFTLRSLNEKSSGCVADLTTS